MATEEEGFSLADFADVDVSDIEEVRFQTLPAGAFEFEITDADLAEDDKDGERRFKVEVELKILEVKAVLETGVDKESLVGKKRTERFFIKPGDTEENVKHAIGRVRAFVTDVGMDSKGKLGDIVRNLKGHTFAAKIIKQKDRHDRTREYARLQLDAKK
jgi:hypothetical protein